MIKIEENKCTVKGDSLTVFTELNTLWEHLNKMISSQPNPKICEELIVSSDIGYKEFCRLAVRLNEAHKRVVDTKRAYRDKNK